MPFVWKERLKMNSFIPWIGGKKLLRKEILSRFPMEEPSRYIEVFGGAGWVLFAKEHNSKQLEVYNDLNGDLVNLYRCVKYHAQEVQRECEFLLNSREIFLNYKEQMSINGLTDIQRAARFLYIIKVSFGADGKTYGTNAKNISYSVNMLPEISKRLNRVVIENKNYDNLIKVYDRNNALFYLDPPYYKTEKYYGNLFDEKEHVKLRDILKDIKGKFILSYNDCEFIRELYADFYIEEVERNNNLVKDGNSRYKELIIRNYK